MEPAHDKRPPRLFLLEFVNRDRFCQYRSELFPFFSGRARELGAAVRWQAFGFDPDAMPEGPFHIALSPEDETKLECALREFQPTHVLLNEELQRSLGERVAAAAPDARLAVFSITPESEFSVVQRFDAWLGQGARSSEADRLWLVDEVEPDYACELANELAREIKPFVIVIGGPHCLYARPLVRNRFYADLDLSEAHRSIACSFCGEGADRRYPYRTRPLALALKQMRAARATLPAARAGGGFAIWGGAQVMSLHRIFTALIEEDFPPAHLFFACRITELRRRARHIDDILPALKRAGHSINIYNMGVENFSLDENDRLNKGVTVADIEVTFANIERWEREYPDNFRFHAHGGFGFILFTPWTTTADLRFNLQQAVRYGIDASSFFFTSRLRIFEGRPIYFLAQRDSLLAEAFEDPLTEGFGDSGAVVSGLQTEVPWRFRSPHVASLYSLLMRLDVSPDVPDDDLLFRRIQALRETDWPGDLKALDLLSATLDALEAGAEPQGPDELLDHVVAPLAELKGRRAEQEEDRGGADLTETPDMKTSRLEMERWAREALELVARNPKRLLRGFEPKEVASHRASPVGFGELRITLARGDDEMRLFVMPRDAVERAFLKSETLAFAHDDATPADTLEKERLIDMTARILERYCRARRRQRGENAE